MIVLSLFDGMSCGQIALKELGVQVEKYYASEIDKYAIQTTKLNFPKTIQLGDVEKWREWGLDWESIDLLIGGSPCQGFSFAGKQLAFNDPRSRLFFVYVDILNHIRQHNPNIKFLLENVRMKQEHINVITDYLGVYPVFIDSSLVSAQMRKRLYWSNIRTRQEGLWGDIHTDIPQPKDRGLCIKDVLEDNVDDKYFLTNRGIEFLKRHSEKNNRGIVVLDNNDKSRCLSVSNIKNYTLDSNYILQRPRGENKGGLFAHKSPTVTSYSYEQNNFVVRGGTFVGFGGLHFREFAGDKFGTLTSRAREDGSGQPCLQGVGFIRRLTPKECARLQTVPEWYRFDCSDSQIYKMLGNGWTVEVIKHIFSYL